MFLNLNQLLIQCVFSDKISKVFILFSKVCFNILSLTYIFINNYLENNKKTEKIKLLRHKFNFM